MNLAGTELALVETATTKSQDDWSGMQAIRNTHGSMSHGSDTALSLFYYYERTIARLISIPWRAFSASNGGDRSRRDVPTLKVKALTTNLLLQISTGA